MLLNVYCSVWFVLVDCWLLLRFAIRWYLICCLFDRFGLLFWCLGCCFGVYVCCLFGLIVWVCFSLVLFNSVVCSFKFLFVLLCLICYVCYFFVWVWFRFVLYIWCFAYCLYFDLRTVCALFVGVMFGCVWFGGW